MPRINVTNFGDYFELPNQGLRTYFGNVVKGQSNIYDTPFAKGESTEQLLQEWDKVLVSISDRWPTLYEFENDLRSKVGPLSIMLPLKDRMKDIGSYYESIHLDSTAIDERALKAVISEWSPARGLRLRGQKKTIELMKKSTNSGAPFFTKRRNVVDKTYPVYMDYRTNSTETYQHLPQSGYWTNCAVLGWRGQEGGPNKEDVKQRVVWMFPLGVNICELQVYQPLIEAAQRFNIVPAWVSMDAVDRGITKLFDTKSSDDLVVCTDFSKFDQHFNENMQNGAETILRGILSGGNQSTDWFYSTFPIKYSIPMCYNWGKLWTGKHGMASGSGGTNADETLVHRALQYEAAMHNKQMLNPNSQCLGDDGIITYPGITVEDVMQSYTSHGLEMNDQKQYASTIDTVYLRRWHHKQYRDNGVCVGVYATMRALGRMRYLERFMNPEIWDAEAVELRYYSILENLKWHPLREQFVQFCMKRDKYRLGLDIPNFLDNLAKITQEKIDVMPEFLGWRATLNKQGSSKAYGIADWWIVKYLKSKM
nr:MAG: RNA-dependent RNA-polymerase [Picobirnavirus sp.]